MAKKQLMLLASLLLVLSVFLAACSGKDDEKSGETDTSKETETETEATEEEEEPAEEPSAGLDFPLTVSNTAAAIEDGEMTIAMVSDTPFEGTLNRVFYSGTSDAQVISFFEKTLLQLMVTT